MKTSIGRLVDRLVNGRRCPDCPHDLHYHVKTDGCLGMARDEHGLPAGFCACKRKPGPFARWAR